MSAEREKGKAEEETCSEESDLRSEDNLSTGSWKSWWSLKEGGRGEEEKRKRRGRPTKVEQLGRSRANSLGGGVDKRKREEDGEKGRWKVPASKSAKMQRTPPKGRTEETSAGETSKEEEKRDVLIQSLIEQIKEWREEQRETDDKWKQDLQRVEDRMDEKMKKRNQELERRVKEIEICKGKGEIHNEEEGKDGRLKELEWKMEMQERRDKKNNIVIRGLMVERGREQDIVKGEIEKFLEEKVQWKGKVESARLIGKEGDKIIVARMKEWKDKEEVMRKKKMIGEERIYIDHDLTWKERNIQREIGKRVREEREKGNKAKSGYQKIYINGRWIRWDEKKGMFRQEEKF